MPAGWDLNRPLGQQEGEAARIFVIACHVHRGQRHFSFVRELHSRTFLQFSEILVRVRVAAETGRTEKHHGILNLFSPETRERLHVFGEDAQDAPVRTVYKGFAFIRQRRRGEFTFTHERLSFHQC